MGTPLSIKLRSTALNLSNSLLSGARKGRSHISSSLKGGTAIGECVSLGTAAVAVTKGGIDLAIDSETGDTNYIQKSKLILLLT